MTIPDAITQYSVAAAAGDIDAFVASCALDAHVADQEDTVTGSAEIRTWRRDLGIYIHLDDRGDLGRAVVG